MKNLKVFLCLASLILLTSAVEIFDRQFIETKLEDIAWEVLYMEETLIKSLTYFGLQVKFASSNLKASKLPKEFTDVLDQLMVAIQEMQTVKDNQKIPIISLDSLASFDYAQFRISTTSSDIKFYKTIIDRIQVNETKLLEFSKNVTSHYVLNYNTLRVLRSKDITASRVIGQFLVIFRNFGHYQRLLTIHSKNAERINSFLTDLIVSQKILPPASIKLDPVLASLKSVEAALAPRQEEVKAESQAAKNKVLMARQSVASSRFVRSTDGSKFNWNELEELLDGVGSANDYSNVGWPQLPDLPGDGKTMVMKLRSKMCEDKEKNFEFIKENARRNRSRIMDKRLDLESVAPVVSSTINGKKVQAQAQPVLDLMESLKKIEGSLGGYDTTIELKKSEVTQMSQNLTKAIEAIPDPYPMTTTRRTTTTVTYPTTMKPVLTTTTMKAATTSTLKPPSLSSSTTVKPAIFTTVTSTTIKVYPCGNYEVLSFDRIYNSLFPTGTFLPYKPVVDDAILKSNGVPAGIYYGGSTIYIGRGDLNSYYGMKPCAARLMLGSGAYMNSYDSMVFDNKTAEYLVYHPDLAWYTVNESTAINHPNAIKWMTGNITNMIGRLNYSDSAVIGRVWNFRKFSLLINHDFTSRLTSTSILHSLDCTI